MSIDYIAHGLVNIKCILTEMWLTSGHWFVDLDVVVLQQTVYHLGVSPAGGRHQRAGGGHEARPHLSQSEMSMRVT